jgi:hypothetical protein
LARAQGALQGALPWLDDQRANHGGAFTPHMTVTHIDIPLSAEAAAAGGEPQRVDPGEDAKAALEATWTPLRFTCSEVHVISRDGKAGQFELRARIPLGGAKDQVTVVRERYDGMPETAPAWVVLDGGSSRARQARRSGRRGGGRGSARHAGPSPHRPAAATRLHRGQ